MRTSRAKATGTFRVFHPSTRRVASHTDTLREARTDATYWSKQTPNALEIQERFPSGEWVTVETVKRKVPLTKSATRSKRAHASMKGRALPPLKRVSTTGGDFDSYLAVHRDPMNEREFRLSWYSLDGTGSVPERGLTQAGFRSESEARAYAQKHYAGKPIRVPAWGVGPDLRKKVGGAQLPSLGGRHHDARRPSSEPVEKMTLQQVRLDRGGYDEGGRYFGHGEPLWSYGNRDDWGHVRARSRAAAKTAITKKHPGARFFR